MVELTTSLEKTPATSLTIEALTEEVARLTEPHELSEELKSRIIDLTKEIPKIKYLIERDGQGCFAIGDIQAIKGKAKSGKTNFILSLLATVLTGEYMGFKALLLDCVSLYIDTEQNPINTAKITQNVHAACKIPLNENNPHFMAINLRGDDPAKRKGYITELVEYFKPKFIIIDGVKDLVEGGDINNPEESNKAIQFLMTLTKQYDLALLTVLHENKGDENMRGHIGTELLNKCSEAWQIKKLDGEHSCEQIENRNEASGNLSLTFRFDEEGRPELIESAPKLSAQDRTHQKKVDTFYFCLPAGKRRSYSDLCNTYMENYGCKDKTAQNDIGTFTRNGYLFKDEVTKDYRFNSQKAPQLSPQTLTLNPIPIL